MTDLQRRWIMGAFSLLVAAAGWYYLFYSRAAQKLAIVEQPLINRKRVKLRRVGGGAMVLLAVAFYVGCDALLVNQIRLFAAMMLLVLLLLSTILVLAIFDLRLTRRLRKSHEGFRRP